MKDLSVIVVSCNTKDLTYQCISKLQRALRLDSLSFEIIIVDNASTDGTGEKLASLVDNDTIKLIRNTTNEGYGKANNKGLVVAGGAYVLFLNSDVFVPEQPFLSRVVAAMEKHPLWGALTVRVQFPTGAIDPASHRGFPTVWRSFCYFSKLERITAHIPLLNRMFGGYHLTHLPLNKQHEIDSPTGAFFLTRRGIVEALQGFDEHFFMYGEYLDLSFRIKRMGYSILYDPTYTVLHLKYQSGIKNTNNTALRSQTRNYFYESMLIFYKKHYEPIYPQWISRLVYFAIEQKRKAL